MDEAKANILLVDDAPDGLVALEAALADLDQNLVKTLSGREALRWLLENECAVILLAVRMPGMDGFETAALIRQRERSRRTPIIFVTGMGTDEAAARRAYSFGAVDYIFKPIVPEIIRAKVEVFVDLFNKERERERERQREIQELRQALAGMSVGEGPAVPEPLPGADGRTLDKLRPAYRDLMQRYIRAVQLREDRPGNGVREFARKLIEVECRARDVVSLHLAVLTEFTQQASPAEDRALATDARLMLVELMGVLMDTYRTRACRQDVTGVSHP